MNGDRKNKNLATFCTFFYSAIWHGFYSGYYVFFISGHFILSLTRKWRVMFLWVPNIPSTIFGYIWTHITGFCLGPAFVMHNLRDVWKYLYYFNFFPVIYIIPYLFIELFIPVSWYTESKKVKNEAIRIDKTKED